MPLPELDDLKRHLGVLTTADDTLLENILTRAAAAAETYLNRPITAAERTFTDVESMYVDGAWRLHVPLYPIASGADVTLTDGEGDEIDAADYVVDYVRGRLRLPSDARVDLANPPYTITATVGLSAYPDYATRIEPAVSQAILDLAADFYQRRAPSASSEGTAGASIAWGHAAEWPPRVKALLNPFRIHAYRI